MGATHLLEVDGLTVGAPSPDGDVELVHGVSFTVDPGETVALIGETGAGKSLTAWGSLALCPAPARVTAGRSTFDGVDLMAASARQLQQIRGNRIGVIVQNPRGALDPMTTVGRQIAAIVRSHRSVPKDEARRLAVEVLDAVGLPEPERCARMYAHELSGGMAQRVLIAAALVNDPSLLIADEPTTGLDLTVQAQILDLIGGQVHSRGLAVLLVTHDLGIVAHHCDRALVMLQGHIVESAAVDRLFAQPEHAYTRQLIEASSLGAVGQVEEPDQPEQPAGEPGGPGGPAVDGLQEVR